MKKINVIKVAQLLNCKSSLACKGFHGYTFSLYIFFLDIQFYSCSCKYSCTFLQQEGDITW